MPPGKPLPCDQERGVQERNVFPLGVVVDLQTTLFGAQLGWWEKPFGGNMEFMSTVPVLYVTYGISKPCGFESEG